MAAYASFLPELDAALARGSYEQRAEALERITHLFLSGAPYLTGDQVGLFDEVFARLVEEIEERALAELSRALAPVRNAPTQIIRRLAHNDNVAVAGPVLKLSPRLPDEDLVGIARTHSQGHLFAIAGRDGIDARITDVLTRRGDREVVRSLAVNPSAKLSEAGYATLVRRAGADGVLAGPIGSRGDLPPALFKRLMVQATAVVQARLLAAATPEQQSDVKRILARIAGEVGAKPARDYRPALEQIAELRRSKALNEQALAGFAKAGEFELAAAALSALCGVPIEIVDRLMSGSNPDPVLILCRALGCQWPTVSAVLSLRVSAGGPAMESAFAQFQRLTPASTQRIVHFWQARPELDADGFAQGDAVRRNVR
jgi:uncharacterized protein (DUF2336 family)